MVERDRGEQRLVVYRDGEAADGFGALEFHHKGAALPDGRKIDAAGLFEDPAFLARIAVYAIAVPSFATSASRMKRGGSSVWGSTPALATST